MNGKGARLIGLKAQNRAKNLNARYGPCRGRWRILPLPRYRGSGPPALPRAAPAPAALRKGCHRGQGGSCRDHCCIYATPCKSSNMRGHGHALGPLLPNRVCFGIAVKPFTAITSTDPPGSNHNAFFARTATKHAPPHLAYRFNQPICIG